MNLKNAYVIVLIGFKWAGVEWALELAHIFTCSVFIIWKMGMENED
ncbi:hypothetical protein PRUB_b0679 [Pseudoalteromonas rubra]|uniref:Uncharacterized protein n=1 Tax=Pseudoalteromonas rubra TaxID=43658 RepID=A0A8T0C0L8_9GAMM|nr:hypothetical protein PRUB_b0679 [Pseudoalteromonas rubra]